MVAGLVAVGVLPDAARDVGLGAAGIARFRVEHLVQALFQGLRSAERLDQPAEVLGHEEAVLPGIGLGVVVVDLARVEGCEPASVEPGAHEARRGVEDVAPVLGGGHIFLVDIHPAEVLRDLGGAPVVIGIFQGLGDAFVLVVGKDQTVGAEAVEPELGPL